MKNKLQYIKNILKVLIWPIIFMIGSFIVKYIFVAIYNSDKKGNMSNSSFLEYIKTIEYQKGLNKFIDSKTIIISLIIFAIFLPIFLSIYKKYIAKTKFKIKNIFIPILFGISISLIYNILFSNINNLMHFTSNYDDNKVNIYILILTSGIIGPILEELLFRGIVYNKLKEFNKPMKSIILTSIIFSIFHFDLLNIILAFSVSFIFIYLYEKYKSIKYPIIMHIVLNITSIVFIRYIIRINTHIYNLIFIMSLVVLLLLKKTLKK